MTSTDDGKKGQRERETMAREARLALALKANLSRRKLAAREAAASEGLSGALAEDETVANRDE